MPMFLFSTNFLPHLTLPSVFDLDFRPEQNGEDAERTVSWHNGALCMKMNGRMRGGRENSAKIISLAEQSKRERKGEERVTSIWEDPSAGLVPVIWQVLLPLPDLDLSFSLSPAISRNDGNYRVSRGPCHKFYPP